MTRSHFQSTLRIVFEVAPLYIIVIVRAVYLSQEVEDVTSRFEGK